MFTKMCQSRRFVRVAEMANVDVEGSRGFVSRGIADQQDLELIFQHANLIRTIVQIWRVNHFWLGKLIVFVSFCVFVAKENKPC